MNQYKILIFSPNFFPYKGGLENYVFNLAKGLIKLNFQVDILTFNSLKIKEYEKISGINVFRIDCKNILGDTYAIPLLNKKTRNLLQKLSLKKYDFVNTHTRFFLSSLLGCWFAKKNNVPLIHTEHGNTFVKHNNKWVELCSWVYDQIFGRLIFHSAKKVIGISKPCCKFAIKMGAKKQKVHYIPNSINLEKFKKIKTNLRSELGITKNQFIVTYVGRIIYAKGIHDLISAIKNVDGVTLIIVGEGPYLKKLKQLAKKTKVRVMFLGSKKQDKIVEILSISDLFVNPSYSEGLPTSVLEAGAVGVPIIATNVGGTKEIIEDGKEGFLIKPQNVKELRSKIIKLIQNQELREQFRKKIEKKVQKEFNFNKNLNTFKKILDQ